MSEKPTFANEILSLSRPAWTQDNLKTAHEHKYNCRGRIYEEYYLKRKGQR